MIYQFTEFEFAGLLDAIHDQVEASSMTDKSIIGCSWSESTKLLEVEFEAELTAADKTALDSIVEGLKV